MTQDKTLTCRDCGGQFTFTASEQDFYAEKGFANEPSRCPSCRAAHKASRGAGGGGRSREMFPAVCAQCGKATEVPFQPRSDRPVYCSECYSAQRGSDRGSRGGGRSGGPRGRGRSDDRW